ncbi:MAG: TonB-dependent siderophore receptor [Pseudomonadota bacterium]
MNHTLLRRLALAGASLAAITAAAPAFAQDAELEGLIVTAPDYVPQGSVTANKANIPLIETPQSVTVITRDQIDLLGWSNLSQVVRYTAGVTGENYGPDERVDWLTIRGFNPVQYIDGLQTAIGSITNTGLDLYGADSVDILKGPSSALYGQTPPGGIVNVTSRRPQTEFGGEVGVLFGNREQKQVNFDVTGTLTDGLTARLTGLTREREIQTRGVESTRTFIAPAVTVKFSEDTRLTLLSYYQKDELTGDGGGFLPSQGTLLPNPIGKIPTTTNLGETSYNRFVRDQAAIGYDFSHDFEGGWTLQQNLKFTELDGDQRGIGGGGFVDVDFNGPDDYRTVSRYSFSFAEKIENFAVDTRFSGGFETGGLSHKVLVGLDYRSYDYVGGSAYNSVGIPTIDIFAPVYGLAIPDLPPVTFSDQLQRQTGLYIQDQIKADRLIITLGARYDWVNTEDRLFGGERDDNDASYRAGLTYVFENGVAPYISYSRSFQPTLGADFAGKAFEPSTGEQIEAGVKYDARNLPDGVKLFATAAVYQLTQQNVLTEDLINLYSKVQIGEVEVKGLELELVGRINERFSFNASYTYTDSEVTDGTTFEVGNALPVTPEHKLSALIDYTFQDGMLAGLGASLGARYTSESAGNLAIWYQPDVFTNPSVTLLDASIHYDRDDWRLALTASNLADKEYVARCYSYSNCFYGTRRVVVASVTRRF